MKITALTVGPVGTNCYLVSDGNGDAAVIDPGAEGRRILACIAEEGLTPKAILLTHGHFDHIGAVGALQKAFGIPVYIHTDDLEMLSDGEKNGSFAFGFPEASVSGAQTLSDGETVRAGELAFTLIHTPGHSKGSCCYRCGGVLFTGDTLFDGGVGRTDLYGGSGRELTASLKKLAGLPGDYQVDPGHGSFTTLAAQRAENPYMGMNGYDDLF